jgi:hypothetical protein
MPWRAPAFDVIVATLTPLGLKATVEPHEGRSSYGFNAQSTRLLEVSCSCQDSGRKGPPCKHAGAVLLALLSGRLPERSLGGSELPEVHPRQLPSSQTGREGRTNSSTLANVHKDLQAAEFEIQQLKDKLSSTEASLQAAQAGPSELPQQPIVQIVDAAGGHARRLAAINEAVTFLFVVAFTYDLDDVTQAIIAAKRRAPGIDARVLLDREQALTGPTRNLRPRVLQLTSHRVPVRLYSRSRLHAKALLTDSAQVWGSLNWTVCSLRNVERCVATCLPAAALAAEQQWFDQLWASARDFAGRELADELLTPARRGGGTQPG